jgi:hypothetical protein
MNTIRMRTLLCLMLAALPAYSTIVDRIAITLGSKVITESEIIRRIRLAAFQNGQLPDYSEISRREAAQRLIDLKLVEREMEIGHYSRTPPDKAKALLDAFTAEHFRSNPEALRLALAGLNLTPADLQAELAEQADLLSFTSLRFRPAVEISDQEIEEYFQRHIQESTNPDKAAASMTLAEARPSIEQILANERADLALEAWLQDQRTRTRINYLEKELAPEGAEQK